MSRVIRPTALGGPDVLEVAHVPTPQPAPGHVVVQVRAAGVNPIDWKLYSGAFHRVADRHKADAGLDDDALPAVGLECAGTITAIGAGVTTFTVGDDVIVFPAKNAYADHVHVATSALIRKPATLDWAAAGGLLLAGTTAAHALHAARVEADDTVLIHGGAGGVGLVAIQLARARGASVIATASAKNHALIERLGCTAVTYGAGLVDRVRAATDEKIDSAIDLVGTDEALDTSLALVPDADRISSIAGGPRRFETGIHVLGNAPGADAGTEFRAAARDDLARDAAAGDLQVVVDQTFPLEDAARAHRVGLAGHPPGKLVLIP